jgi:anti-anti-sigma factor
MIQVNEESRSGWCILAVSGRADAEAAEDLENRLRGAVERHSQVAADFTALDYISSAGLRAVLQAARAAEQRGVRFAVCSPNAGVRRVFDISGLGQVLTIQGELPC